jgi:hyperosmotically inducible protein
VEERVRHALATIPYYNVFDDLSFRVDNGVVTLFGQVTQPVVKDDAGSSVKHIEGVTAVNNEIEVLPLSPFDNQIRRATYRAIYGYPALQRYAMGVVPAIHIIVKDGHVTLKGVVATEMDKQMAFMRANGVPNVFSVDNDLQVGS